MFGILQLKHHKAMWCNGRQFHVKQLDDNRKASDSGITAVFQVTNVSSRSDRHPRESENRYYGFLDDIVECDFNSFKIVLFDVKWYRLRMNVRDDDRTVIQHDNGFPMVKTSQFEAGKYRYVFPSQCEQVFYSEVPGENEWSFAIRYDPRGRPVEYTVEEEDDIDQEEDDAVADEQEDAWTDEEDILEDEPGIGDEATIIDDDVDEDIIENDIIDDDDDMVDHFNTISESDVVIDVNRFDEDQEDTEEEY